MSMQAFKNYSDLVGFVFIHVHVPQMAAATSMYSFIRVGPIS